MTFENALSALCDFYRNWSINTVMVDDFMFSTLEFWENECIPGSLYITSWHFEYHLFVFRNITSSSTCNVKERAQRRVKYSLAFLFS